MRGTGEVSPRLEREVETGLECLEIIINNQNDPHFTLILCRAQAGSYAIGFQGWRWKGGHRGEHLGVSSSNKEGVGQGIVGNRQVLVIA